MAETSREVKKILWTRNVGMSLRRLAADWDLPVTPMSRSCRIRRSVREEIMKTSLTALCGILLLGLVGTNWARADELTFLSTQLRPLEEAQRARTEILKNAPMAVAYVPEEPPQLLIHLQADAQGAHTISLVAALHGELAPLVSLLQPLDAQKDLLAQHEVPSDIVRLAHLG